MYLYVIVFISTTTLDLIFSLNTSNNTKSFKKSGHSRLRNRRWYSIEDEDDDFWRFSNATQEEQEEVMGRKGKQHFDADQFWASKGLKLPPAYDYQKHMYADEIDENTRKKRNVAAKKSNKLYYKIYNENNTRKVFENVILKVFYEGVATVYLSRFRRRSVFKKWEKTLSIYSKLCDKINQIITRNIKEKKTMIDDDLKKNISQLVQGSKVLFDDLLEMMATVDASLKEQFAKMQHWHGSGVVWNMEEESGVDVGKEGVEEIILFPNKNLIRRNLKQRNKKIWRLKRRRQKRSKNVFLDWLWASKSAEQRKKLTTPSHLINSPFRHLQILQNGYNKNFTKSKSHFLISIRTKQDENKDDGRDKIPVKSNDDYESEYEENSINKRVKKVDDEKVDGRKEDFGFDGMDDWERVFMVDEDEDVVERYNRQHNNNSSRKESWRELSDNENALVQKSFG